MKFLKKPIFIKKIRSYNNIVKFNNSFLDNKNSFIQNKNIIKPSYIEKIMDKGGIHSVIKLKGGYYYVNDSFSNDSIFNINKKNITDLGCSFINNELSVSKTKFFNVYFNIILKSKIAINLTIQSNIIYHKQNNIG